MSDHIHVKYEHIRFLKQTATRPAGSDWTPVARAVGTVYAARLAAWDILPRGGSTICRIKNASGNTIGIGVAKCSASDNFCKKIGRKIALDRALHAAGIDRNDL